MVKRQINRIDRQVLLGVVRDHGLVVEEMVAYEKCTHGEGPARIYIAKTQKVSRIHLAGFTTSHSGVKQVSEVDAKFMRMGSVRGELDFTQDRQIVLDALGEACEALKVTNHPAEGDALEAGERPEEGAKDFTVEDVWRAIGSSAVVL